MELTLEEIDELRESFAFNDANDDGRIDFEEFTAMLRNLEAGIDREAARVGFDEIDTDGDNAIAFDEFTAWWSDR